jgi:hypothetical protein
MGGMMLRRGAPFEARPLGAHLRMTGIGKCVRHPEVGATRPSKDAPPPPLTASRTERSGDPGRGRIGEGGKRAVIPAQAGIQILVSAPEWIPAFAGMTEEVEVGATRPSKDAPPPPLTASRTERSGGPGPRTVGTTSLDRDPGSPPDQVRGRPGSRDLRGTVLEVVIPAKAGTQLLAPAAVWSPACAGMTKRAAP